MGVTNFPNGINTSSITGTSLVVTSPATGGTASPVSVASAVNTEMVISSTGAGWTQLRFTGGSTKNFITSDDPLSFFVNSGERMYINATGQVGLGSTPSTIVAAALLDLDSTTMAFMPPRMTTAQRDAITGVAGMMIYNSTTNKLNVYTTAWEAVTSA